MKLFPNQVSCRARGSTSGVRCLEPSYLVKVEHTGVAPEFDIKTKKLTPGVDRQTNYFYSEFCYWHHWREVEEPEWRRKKGASKCSQSTAFSPLMDESSLKELRLKITKQKMEESV